MARNPFDYNRHWKIFEPTTEDGEPMLVYLTKGEHIIEMTPVVGPLRRTHNVLQDAVTTLGKLQRAITMITGADPDPNFDWQIHKTLPTLLPTLQNSRRHCVRSKTSSRVRRLLAAPRRSAQHDGVCAGGHGPQAGYDPPPVAGVLDSGFFADVVDAEVAEASLVLDYFLVASPDTVWPGCGLRPRSACAAASSRSSCRFTTDYTGLSSQYATEKSDIGEVVEGPVIEVWVGRGREWAMIVKEMVEEDFTPKTGIHVNMNIIPAAQADIGGSLSVILLAAATGTTPDVTIGSNAQLPVEFAIRNGVVNLNEFPDYEEVAARFRPGALIPYKWTNRDGVEGDYALPETQGFSMLFYRTDLLAQVGLTPPDTWEDDPADAADAPAVQHELLLFVGTGRVYADPVPAWRKLLYRRRLLLCPRHARGARGLEAVDQPVCPVPCRSRPTSTTGCAPVRCRSAWRTTTRTSCSIRRRRS